MANGNGRGMVVARMLGEFGVIVIGVLVALGVDGWAERQANRERETEMLLTLRVDLETSVNELRAMSAAGAERVETLAIFLQFPLDRAADYPSDSIPRITRAVHITGSYSPVLRTYDALVATGAFGLVQNDDLLVELVAVRSAVDEYVDYRRQATDAWNQTYAPIWFRKVGVGTTRFGEDPLPPLNMGPVLRDREFRAIVQNRAIFLDNVSNRGLEVADQMEGLLDLVNAELAMRGVS